MSSSTAEKEKKIIIDAIGRHPLSADEILKYVKILKIPYFRGVFMRDTLPNSPPFYKESMIVNLDSIQNKGTHWVCFKKENDQIVSYFDSFGMVPPSELITYWQQKNPSILIEYNSQQNQKIKENICGHLCIHFLLQ